MPDDRAARVADFIVRARRFGWALLSAVAPLLLWELGKSLGRRARRTR